MTKEELLKRILKRTQKSETTNPQVGTQCLLWIGAKFGNGYGHMRIGGKDFAAHRIAWRSAHGEIPHGVHVLHRCDTPACVNVEHLFLGTHFDNMADCARKGRNVMLAHPERHPRGSATGTSKLTEQDVVEIRKSKDPVSALVSKFGISRSNVYRCKNRELWSHVP